MIEIKALLKSFGKNQVLKGLSATISKSKITAILGPNGSGKTTLIKSILGMVIPDKGTITIDGVNIKDQSEYRRNINYLPQIARFPENLKVRELIHMIKDLRSQPTDESELVQIFKLKPYLGMKLRTLSGGTRQKVNVALAFMYDTPLIIMDEPTAGLDPVAILHLKEMIALQKKAGKTIIFTTHIISLVEDLADEIIFLLEGKIYFKGELIQMKNEHDAESLEKSIAMILEKEEYA
jgi:Cu-processing system ATP-binding protein